MFEVLSKEGSTARDVGRAFLAHADIILPTLVVYILSGPYSLRVWTAAKHLQSRPPTTKEDEKPGKPWYKSLRFIISAIFVGYYLAASLLRPDQSFVYNWLASVYCTVFSSFVVAVFLRLSGVAISAVTYNGTGLPMVLPVSRKTRVMKTLDYLISAACLAVTFFAFVFDNSICLALVYMAILHSLIDIRSQKVQSIRNIIIFASGLISISVVLNIGLFLLFKNGLLKKHDGSSTGGASHFMRDFVYAVARFLNWWNSVLFAALPQTLIAICYRFDNPNILLANPTSEFPANYNADVLEFVEVTSAIGPGVILPKAVPRSFSFRKPYYLTALGAWCTGSLLFSYLVTVKDIIRFNNTGIDRSVFGLVMGAVATPIMILAIVGLASLRGDLKKMWKYEEEWGVAPTHMDSEGGKGSDVEAKPLLEVAGKEGKDVI